MWNVWTAWAAASNRRAIDNARIATTACLRRRVEANEVALYLARHTGAPSAEPGARGECATR